MGTLRKAITPILILVCGLILLSTGGCNKSYNVIPLDPETGYYSDQKPETNEILKNQPLPGIDEYKIVYLRGGEGCNNDFCLNYVRSMISNMNQFNTIFIKNELEQLIIKNGLSGSITNISDLVGLNQLSQKIGKFIIVDAILTYMSDYSLYGFEIKVTSPLDGKLYFHSYRAEKNYLGLDEPVFYPVFNSFIDWIKLSKEVRATQHT